MNRVLTILTEPNAHAPVSFQDPLCCGLVSSPFSVSCSTSWDWTLCAMTSQAGFAEPSLTSQPWRPPRSCSSPKGEPRWVWDRAAHLSLWLFLFSNKPVSEDGSLEIPSVCSSRTKAMTPIGVAQCLPGGRADLGRAE